MSHRNAVPDESISNDRMEMTMTKKEKPATSYCVADALSEAMGEIESLRDEMQDWYDNMPEGLQGGDKGSEVEECAQTLGAFENVTLHEALETADEDGKTETGAKSPNVGHLRFDIVRSTKKRQSRNDRRNEATLLLRAACDAVRTEMEATDNDDERLDPYAETRADIDDCLNELDQVADEVDGADFPGMYG